MTDRLQRSPWITFSAVAVGVLMSTLDGSIVNVALPTLSAHFGVPVSSVEWVVSAYLLAVSVSLLTLGRLGDLLGYRRIFVGGMLLFTAGSLLCGLAPDLGLLVAARVVQALGGSALMALGPAVITAVFPLHRRGRALGTISSVVAVGLTAGAPLGGAILQRVSWHWVFFVNVPVGLAGALWAARVIPDGPRETTRGFDLFGALFSAAALAALIGALNLVPHEGASGRVLLLAGGALALGAAFAIRERRAPSPVMDLGLLGHGLFAAGTTAILLAFVALFSTTLLVPFYLARVRGLDPDEMGLVLTAVPAVLFAVSPLSGWVSDRIGSRALCTAGMLLLAAGLAALATVGPQTALWSVVGRLGLCGLGIGLFQPPNNAAVLSSLPRDRLGSGAGIFVTARNVGMVLGIALAGSLFSLRAGTAAAGRPFLAGIELAFGAAAGIALLAALISALRPTGPVEEELSP